MAGVEGQGGRVANARATLRRCLTRPYVATAAWVWWGWVEGIGEGAEPKTFPFV